MGVTSNRHWLITALLTLFVTVFVLIPVADAAACSVEPEPTHAPTHATASTADLDHPAASDADDPGLNDPGLNDSGPNDSGPGEPDVCTHGHCHHGGVVLPQPTDPGLARAAPASPVLKPANTSLASHSPNGLKRPPRG